MSGWATRQTDLKAGERFRDRAARVVAERDELREANAQLSQQNEQLQQRTGRGER